MAEDTLKLRSLSVEERRDLLSRMATGELTVTKYTDDGTIEEGPGFNIRLAAIIELNRMDEKLPPPKHEAQQIIFPGKKRFQSEMREKGVGEEDLNDMCRRIEDGSAELRSKGRELEVVNVGPKVSDG